MRVKILQTGKTVLRIILAGIVALAILSLLFCFYSLLPVHITNPKGNTDYIWPANSHWIISSEGIAWGKYDGNGFNNSTIIENPDVLVLGSSHMEATNVKQDENMVAVYNRIQADYKAYNQGISGHDLYKVAHYLPKSLELLKKLQNMLLLNLQQSL